MPFRRQDTSREGSTQASLSSSSLSSSFSSSAGSSMLQPAAPPSNSSQSDIGTLDHSAQSSPFIAPKGFFHPKTIKPVPRTSSLLPAMGQSGSRPDVPNPPPSPSPSPVKPASTGSRLKRVFATRKKKTEDEPGAHVPPQLLLAKGRGRSFTEPTTSGYAPVSPSPLSADLPPTPPEKSPHMRPDLHAKPSTAEQRGSVLVASPGMAPALQYMSQEESEKDQETSLTRKKDQEHEKMKEDWRKSDSTTTSYYTVRPRSATSTTGTRTPRPVSMAESLHSTTTVVPATKRLSALLTDAEFIMTEEEVSVEAAHSMDSGHSARRAMIPLARTASPSGSSKTRKRHSISLHFSSPFPSSPTPPSSNSSDVQHGGGRPSLVQRTTAETTSGVPSLTRAAANGIIGPSRGENSTQSTGSHIKGRLAAASTAPTSYQERGYPDQPPRSASTGNASFRQTAISMSNGFAPAAGFAKRAVERMGRALGNLSSNHSSSGYSSSTSSLADSADEGVGRNSPSGHLTPAGKGKQRRTPNAPSGTWSISTAGTSSTGPEHDTFGLSSGPSLGTRIRGPIRIAASGASVAGGMVFGRDLQTCVRDTAIDPVRHAMASNEENRSSALEERLLPALVVRCVQHIMKWGVEEEGLFRISGRASHVARLRSEFDTGADYDMLECAPGDLDPHAVSSVFKAYLRELPEPILTHALNPYFEAAMLAETNARKSEEPPQSLSKVAGRSGGLPSGPRDGHVLRKPPSLSTLAMPNFAGMRPPSQGLLDAFASLLSRLPQENRDLLRTVAELISFTSKRKEIRMPLSNLTVVFCPSLNMSPPILRVLCEAPDIWDGPSKDVVDPLLTDAEPDTNQSTPTPDNTEDVNDERGAEESPTSLASPLVELPDLPDVVIGPEKHVGPSDDAADAPRIEVVSDDADAPPSDVGSDISAVESRPSTPPASPPLLYNPHSPPALSSSTDSLATPSTVSEDPDFNPTLAKGDPSFAPLIVDEDSAPTTPSHPTMPPLPVSFPRSDSAPGTPTSLPYSSLISLPIEREPSENPQPRSRGKRPSLTALFSKRSVSSLRSSKLFLSSPTFLSAQGSPAGSSSPSTPASMVTASQGSSPSLPPVLDTPIDSSRISVGLDVEVDSPKDESHDKAGEDSTGAIGAAQEPSSDDTAATDSSPPVSPASSITPIADHFRQPNRPAPAPFALDERPLRGQTSQASFTSGSTTTFHRLSLWEDDTEAPAEDDWANSVIKAADISWTPSEATQRTPVEA